MKAKALLFAALITTTVYAAQDSFKFVRTYKVGDKDAYSLDMKMQSPQLGELNMQMSMSQTVKKVYENGDADLETSVDSMVVNVMGQTVNPPHGKAATARYGPMGNIVNGDRLNNGADMMNISAAFGGKDLKVGQKVTFDQPNPKDPKTRTKGWVRLDSIEQGTAKLTASLDLFTAASETPMHIDCNSSIDVASGKSNRTEGKATNMPQQGNAPKMDSMTFVITRKSS